MFYSFLSFACIDVSLLIYLGMRKEHQSKEKELPSKKALREKKKGDKKEKPVSKKVKKDGKDNQKGNKAMDTGYTFWI